MEWSIFTIANVTSIILASVTAYLYFWLPNVQDSYGTCIFHFSLNLALMHVILFFFEFTLEHNYLIGGYCMIGVYVLIYVVVALNIWSVILSYNTWKEVKQMQLVNQMYPTRRLNYYRLLAYVISALSVIFIICVLIIQHEDVFYSTYRFQCYYVITYSTATPGLVVIILNVFYFVDSQRRLWNFFTNISDAQNENYSQSSSSTVALKYRILLNLKLCLTMNIPFCLSTIILLIVIFTWRFVDNSADPDVFININYYIASLQGTLIFLAAVAFRKRAIKGFMRYGDNLCFGCVQVPECLRQSANNDVEETDDEAERHPEEERGTTLQGLRDEYGA